MFGIFTLDAKIEMQSEHASTIIYYFKLSSLISAHSFMNAACFHADKTISRRIYYLPPRFEPLGPTLLPCPFQVVSIVVALSIHQHDVVDYVLLVLVLEDSQLGYLYGPCLYGEFPSQKHRKEKC